MQDLKKEVEEMKNKKGRSDTDGMTPYEREEEKIMAALKTEINEFLFPRVPGVTMIEEFEAMALDLFNRIQTLWEDKNPGRLG